VKFIRFASFFVLAMSGCTKPARPLIDRLEVEAFAGGYVIALSKDQLRDPPPPVFIAPPPEVEDPGF